MTAPRRPVDDALDLLATLRDGSPQAQTQALLQGKEVAKHAWHATRPRAARRHAVQAAAWLLLAAEVLDAEAADGCAA